MPVIRARPKSARFLHVLGAFTARHNRRPSFWPVVAVFSYHLAVLDLLPDLSFSDNLRPSQFTSALRRRLLGQQSRTRRSFIRSVIGMALLFDMGLGVAVLSSSPDALPWASVLAWEAIAIVAVIIAISIWHSRRSAFFRDAAVITAAVMEATSISLPAIGGIPSWMISSPRNIAEALEQEKEGLHSDVLYVVTLRLRFRPGWTNEQLSWDDLRDEVFHVDVTKRLLCGGWGTFAYGLKRGSLVSLLYSPENARNCLIVQEFHPAQNQIDQME